MRTRVWRLILLLAATTACSFLLATIHVPFVVNMPLVGLCPLVSHRWHILKSLFVLLCLLVSSCAIPCLWRCLSALSQKRCRIRCGCCPGCLALCACRVLCRRILPCSTSLLRLSPRVSLTRRKCPPRILLISVTNVGSFTCHIFLPVFPM